MSVSSDTESESEPSYCDWDAADFIDASTDLAYPPLQLHDAVARIQDLNASIIQEVRLLHHLASSYRIALTDEL